MSAAAQQRSYRPIQRAGLVGGLVVFVLVLVLPAPEGLGDTAGAPRRSPACMALWWLTEAIPIPATALLPLVLFPALGILSMGDAAAPYAQDLIFLFMGGFMIAAAMERWGLHKRIALNVMAATGSSPSRLILGFMLATAFLSMWISNTATTAMLLPVGVAVAETLRPPDQEGPFNFGIALMLGIAYAASIGGVSTLIGTPPNAIYAAAAADLAGVEVGFGQWMLVGLPLTLVLLPITWLMLTRVLYRPGKLGGDAAEVIRTEREALGTANRGEWIVGIVFAATAAAWIFRAPKELGAFTLPGIQSVMPQVGDATIAMAAAMALFLLPVDWSRGVFALDWPNARRIPWGVLVLFGGGLSLARAMDRSGLASWIGGGVAGLETVPTVVVLGAVALLFVFLTEVTSNAATATMAMPIMAGVALQLGIPPIALMTTAGLACSMAFMLPVATPPNAIVFGSDYLTIPQMSRAAPASF